MQHHATVVLMDLLSIIYSQYIITHLIHTHFFPNITTFSITTDNYDNNTTVIYKSEKIVRSLATCRWIVTIERARHGLIRLSSSDRHSTPRVLQTNNRHVQVQSIPTSQRSLLLYSLVHLYTCWHCSSSILQLANYKK